MSAPRTWEELAIAYPALRSVERFALRGERWEVAAVRELRRRVAAALPPDAPSRLKDEAVRLLLRMRRPER